MLVIQGGRVDGALDHVCETYFKLFAFFLVVLVFWDKELLHHRARPCLVGVVAIELVAFCCVACSAPSSGSSCT